MELTSTALVWSLALLGTAALVATIWLWPRLARQRLQPILGRVGLLAVIQLSLVCVIALCVNNSYGFYTSWNDLLHPGGVPLTLAAGEHGKGAVPAGGKLVQPTSEGGLDSVQNLLPQGKPEEVGRVESVKVTGTESGLTDQVFVYLPPEYFIPRYARERFPVLLTLAGYPGPSLHLVEGLRVPATAWDLEKAGKIAPTIIVMARPTVAPPRNTECVDVPNGPRTETWFAKDLPTALQSAYRVSRSPASWGVLGYSTGGSCALRLAMRFPNVFASAAGLHAEYQVANDRWTGGDLFGGDHGLTDQHDLNWRLKNVPLPKVSLLVVSTRTEDNYPETEAFLGNAEAATAGHPDFHVDSLFLPDGGHSFETWRAELPASLEWLNDHLKTPQDREPRQ